jgi:hypothetical protein
LLEIVYDLRDRTIVLAADPDAFFGESNVLDSAAPCDAVLSGRCGCTRHGYDQGEAVEELEENIKDAYLLMALDEVPEGFETKEITI